MSKHKVNHHLKRVIHPNRYFIWALNLIIFGGIFLTLHIMTETYATESESAFPELQTKKTYRNERENYTVRYPKGWYIETDGNSVIFSDASDSSESITVEATTLGSENIIRRSLRITEEVPAYTRDGMTISLISGTTGQNEETQAAIIKTSKRLYYLYGNSDAFDSFVGNFKAFVK